MSRALWCGRGWGKGGGGGRDENSTGTKDTAPEGGMRAGEGTVGEGENGDHHEEHRHPNQAGVDVAVPVQHLVPDTFQH